MKVEPAAAIRGAIAVPGVKGISQRAVLLGAITDGTSRIRGFGRCPRTSQRDRSGCVVCHRGADPDLDRAALDIDGRVVSGR